ncbi:replication initiation protein [Streptosporangiaceae bacterium NEAU-GS5]|nr:replication initiation protein [Streptosporangiaceae bacterium NEAU-GS5]
MRDLIDLVNHPGYARWRQMVAATGGCRNPVHLRGQSDIVDLATGEVLYSYDSAGEPSGHLLTACGNRRASVCPACSQLYQADTFQLIRAGLSGGKGISAEVATHPRVFVTLTAPSFGPVHTRREHEGAVRLCRPRRGGSCCEHDQPMACRARHEAMDPLLGQPICPECYDYVGAVLWQAHAGVLWHRFTLELRRVMASMSGHTRDQMRGLVRLSFAKVAEYQRRGLVHYHAIIRLDGPDGPASPPPDWADLELLERAVTQAAARARVTTPPGPLGQREVRWGDQLDIRPILASADTHHLDHQLSDQAVAAYVAKYATKGAEASGTVDHRICCQVCAGKGRVQLVPCERCRGSGLKPGLLLDALPVTDHARRMIRTCWDLGGRPEYAGLRLRAWAHMLGFRGHFSTKSRQFAVTLGELRRARADHRADQAREREGLPLLGANSTLVVGHWRFAGTGHTPGEAVMAEHIRQRVAMARKISAERDGE